mmetsp:Transcript_872/g.1412  ORF Transcript_872/g.1412 Transcript_872/m.1412 type:complete len:87 (+) Transcript_872:13-273(+)
MSQTEHRTKGLGTKDKREIKSHNNQKLLTVMRYQEHSDPNPGCCGSKSKSIIRLQLKPNLKTDQEKAVQMLVAVLDEDHKVLHSYS